MEKTTTKLNLEGEICPYPLISTIKKVEEMEKDLREERKILEVITDCAPTIENIPFELERRNFKVEIKKIEPLKWKIIIKK